MSLPNDIQVELIPLLTALCSNALADEPISGKPVVFYTRAPEGKTIAHGAFTISLDRNTSEVLDRIVSTLRQVIEFQVRLSEAELQNEVVTTMFEGTEALETGSFEPDTLARSLLERLRREQATWEVYIPIHGLELPERCELMLAGGTIKSLANNEKSTLKDTFINVAQQGKWNSPEQTASGLATLAERFDQTMGSSLYWFHIKTEGRAGATRVFALEQANLALDILRFFAFVSRIDPEACSIGLPSQAPGGVMYSLQMVEGQSWTLNAESSGLYPYKLDIKAFAKLTQNSEFMWISSASNKLQPSNIEEKFLLGVQQFAEATRLPSASSKLVWYLSAAETVLAKESEGSRHKKVEKRIQKLLGQSTAQRVTPLYNERRKPVHYGYRNRIGKEFMRQTDMVEARALAYLGIMSAIQHAKNSADHDSFLDQLDI